MEIIQVILILFALFALSRVILNLRERNLHLLEAIFWSGLWLLVVIITLIPEYISRIANLFGIGRGVDLLIYLGLVLLAYLIFRLYAKLEGVEKRVTKIIRTVAIKNHNREQKLPQNDRKNI